MDGQLVQKTFTLNNTSFDCWVIKIGHKFWFKAYDIAVFLGYKNPDDAVQRLVPSKAQKQWDLVRPLGFQGALEPSNWQPHTVLISEYGLYRLICRSKKPEAVKFEEWVFDDLLPTLRETGTYKINQQLHKRVADLGEQLAIQDRQIEKLYELIA